MKKISVNHKVAPDTLEVFKKWHSKACPDDSMKAEDRFKVVEKDQKEWKARLAAKKK